MTIQPIDTLAALDWKTIGCQSARRDCTRHATHQLELHVIDDCNDASPFGNDVELLCDECLDEERAAIGRYLANLAQFPGRVACLTCGAPVAEPGDILRAVRAL